MRWGIVLLAIAIIISGCLSGEEVSKEEILNQIDSVDTFSYHTTAFINVDVSNAFIRKIEMTMIIDGYSNGRISKGNISLNSKINSIDEINEFIPFYIEGDKTFIKLSGKWQRATKDYISNNGGNILNYVKELIIKNDIKTEKEDSYYIIKLKDDNINRELNSLIYRNIKLPEVNIEITGGEVEVVLDENKMPIKVIKKAKIHGTSSQGDLEGSITIETDIKDINKNFDFSKPEDLNIS